MGRRERPGGPSSRHHRRGLTSYASRPGVGTTSLRSLGSGARTLGEASSIYPVILRRRLLTVDNLHVLVHSGWPNRAELEWTTDRDEARRQRLGSGTGPIDTRLRWRLIDPRRCSAKQRSERAVRF